MIDLHALFRGSLPAIQKECLARTAATDLVAQFGVFETYFGPYISPCCETRHRHAIFQADTTREKVGRQIKKDLRRLRRWGVAVEYLWDLKIDHFRRLTEYDARIGLDYHTIQDNRAARRRLYCWISKCHHIDVHGAGRISPDVERTPSFATVNYSWWNWNVDFWERLSYVREQDLWVAHDLKYMKFFGLRPSEPLDLDVHKADLGEVLVVKGKHGLVRVVPVETAEQRAHLDQMKSVYGPGPMHLYTGRSGPEAALRRVEKVAARHLMLTKQLCGTVLMGLRQAYACDVFTSIAGVLAPVRGGPAIAGGLDAAARGITALCLGHGYERTCAEYLGETRVDRRLSVSADHPGLQRAARIQALLARYDHLRIAERQRPRDHRIDRDPLKLRALLNHDTASGGDGSR